MKDSKQQMIGQEYIACPISDIYLERVIFVEGLGVSINRILTCLKQGNVPLPMINPARKSTPIDVEGRVNNYQVSEEVKEKKKHKCLKEKLPIILSVVLVMGVAVGVYFVVVSTDDNKNDKKSFSTKSQRNKTSKIQSTDESVDVTAGLVEVEDKEINGTRFATDPICRDFMKSSVFVFDCFHQRAFNDLPLNSTVKCSYLNKVGLCIQSLLENEYEVDCNRLDQLYLLNLNAEVLMERSNFNVRSECGDWYEFYFRATNTTLE